MKNKIKMVIFGIRNIGFIVCKFLCNLIFLFKNLVINLVMIFKIRILKNLDGILLFMF